MRPVPRAVLFDLDGTLLDTAPDMIGALNALRSEHALGALSTARVRPAVSHGSARLVQLGFPEAAGEDFVRLQRRFLEIYGARLSAETRLFEGMAAVLAQLAARGLAIGIVTNKPARLTEALLRDLALRDLFACVVSGDSLPQRKPHPLPMLHAAAAANASPAECIYVGDAQRDVQAAHAAGMPALVATYGYLGEDEDWRVWGADGFIDRPLELLAWLGRRGAS